MIAFTIPIIDTATVSLHRMMRRQSPFVGGRDHTTHHLAYHGFKDKHVLIIFFVCSLFSAAAAIAIHYFFEHINSLMTFIIYMYFVFLFLLVQFYYVSAKRKQAEKI
jgi:UDP-GlcNAc:undecaprenyl-phosphate GlcNAc-1-phosphate transferase